MNLKELKQLTNEQLIERFPFVKCRNRFSGEESEGIELCRQWGWYDLELLICEHIKPFYDSWNKELKERFMILDSKEKYGTLRFYISFGNDEIYKTIRDAEHLSRCVCTNCGKLKKNWNGKKAIIYKEKCFYGSCFCKKCAKEISSKNKGYEFRRVSEPFIYKISKFGEGKIVTEKYNSLELYNTTKKQINN